MWELHDAIDSLDGLLAEQEQRIGVTARVAQHADQDGWRSWVDNIARRLRRDSSPRMAGTESVASIRARKLKDRESRG